MSIDKDTARRVAHLARIAVDEAQLEESPEGFLYLPAVIPPERMRLARRDVLLEPW